MATTIHPNRKPDHSEKSERAAQLQHEIGRLPTPTDRPKADVVIYDGHCRFCANQVIRLAKIDRTGRLAYISLHDPQVAQLFPELTHDALMREMHIITPEGQKYIGGESFCYLTRRLPWLWPLAPLMHLPGTLPIWKYGYRLVARYRYKFGKIDSCESGGCEIHFR